MNKTDRKKKARYPIQTTGNQILHDRVSFLRNIHNVNLTTIIEEGCAVIEKRKGLK